MEPCSIFQKKRALIWGLDKMVRTLSDTIFQKKGLQEWDMWEWTKWLGPKTIKERQCMLQLSHRAVVETPLKYYFMNSYLS